MRQLDMYRREVLEAACVCAAATYLPVAAAVQKAGPLSLAVMECSDGVYLSYAVNLEAAIRTGSVTSVQEIFRAASTVRGSLPAIRKSVREVFAIPGTVSDEKLLGDAQKKWIEVSGEIYAKSTPEQKLVREEVLNERRKLDIQKRVQREAKEEMIRIQKLLEEPNLMHEPWGMYE